MPTFAGQFTLSRLERVISGMKPFYGTTSDVAVLSCAGSGGLEAAIELALVGA